MVGLWVGSWRRDYLVAIMDSEAKPMNLDCASRQSEEHCKAAGLEGKHVLS